jgi:prepilin-type N-terminal cleavage/methylation domain-containing protein
VERELHSIVVAMTRSLKSLGSRDAEAGFSLLEVLVAAAIMAGTLATLGQLFAISVANNRAAGASSHATVLAAQKLEQLRGLTWGDTSTDTASAVESPAGGTGLSVSPAGSLATNVNGYVDYIDRFGVSLGGGTSIPPRTVYIRRWSIEPILSGSGSSIALRVFVTRYDTRTVAVPASSRMWDEARLIAVKTSAP